MKAIVNTADLKRYLKAARPLIQRNNSLPIMGTVQFIATDNHLTCTVSNLEQFFNADIPANVLSPGEICIPFADLYGFIDKFKGQTVAIESTGETVNISGLTLPCYIKKFNEDTGEFYSEYPLMPEIDGAKSLEFSPILFDELSIASKFTGSDVFRSAMSGIYIGTFEREKVQGELKKGAKKDIANVLTIAATDAHKLYKAELAEVPEAFSAIVPKIAALQIPAIAKLYGGEADTITFSYLDSHAVFTQSEWTFITRLIDDNYPKINAVIPDAPPITATFNKSALLTGIDIVKLAANKTTNQIKVEIQPDSCKLVCSDIDDGRYMETEIHARSNDAINIGFNWKFLTDVIKATISPEVSLLLTNANKAMLIEEFHRTFLLMPVMLPTESPVSSEAEA